jgi:hypothetical protein
MEDSYFGQLKYSEDLDWYSREIKLYGSNVSLNIKAEKGSVDLRKSEKLIEALNKKIPKVRDVIADELYDIYREEWAGRLFKVNRDKFKDKLELEAVVIHRTNDLDLYFKDGGLFSDHVVVVRFSLDKGFHNVVLSG